jgi:hypothetical protein
VTAASSPASRANPITALEDAQRAVDAAVTAAAARAPGGGGGLHGWTPELVQFLAVAILLFTLAALLLCTALMWRNRASGYHVLRVFGIVSILGISALLLVVGYSNEQLTPIVGLFGAVAGYLLGKDTTSTTPPAKAGEASQESPPK